MSSKLSSLLTAFTLKPFSKLESLLDIFGGGTMMLSKYKLICVLIIALAVLTVPLSARAEDKQRKKKKGQPPPVIVTLPAPPPPPPRPANGSLFSDYAPGYELLADFKAGRVGDLIFVDVIETSAASVSSSAKRSRDSGTLGGLTGAVGALPISSAATIAEVLTGLGQRKYEGSGATERKSTLTARIAARVIQVLPNGDLLIAAQKTVRINKEEERLTLTGIVRRSDLSAGNAIPTTAIGDLQVGLNGKGVASADNAPGWLFRLFDKVSPF
jgi:flagellar L-ring protein precursor FlgH